MLGLVVPGQVIWQWRRVLRTVMKWREGDVWWNENTNISLTGSLSLKDSGGRELSLHSSSPTAFVDPAREPASPDVSSSSGDHWLSIRARAVHLMPRLWNYRHIYIRRVSAELGGHLCCWLSLKWTFVGVSCNGLLLGAQLVEKSAMVPCVEH